MCSIVLELNYFYNFHHNNIGLECLATGLCRFGSKLTAPAPLSFCTNNAETIRISCPLFVFFLFAMLDATCFGRPFHPKRTCTSIAPPLAPLKRLKTILNLCKSSGKMIMRWPNTRRAMEGLWNTKECRPFQEEEESKNKREGTRW